MKDSKDKKNKKDKKDKKDKKNKGIIKLPEFIFILLCAGILILVVLKVNSNNKEAHCNGAICNENNTICYKYGLDKNGNTIRTWKGSCK